MEQKDPENLSIVISREALAQLPLKRYEGPVKLVTTPAELEHAHADLIRERVVGLDTETQPTFRVGQVHWPSLVQVAASKSVYLFQLKKVDSSRVLQEILESSAVAKTGIGLSQDLGKLKELFPFEEKNVVELTTVARKHGFTQTGVRNLAGLCLGFRIAKGQSTSNWARQELKPSQIRYAATDAWICRELYLHFQQRGTDESL